MSNRHNAFNERFISSLSSLNESPHADREGLFPDLMFVVRPGEDLEGELSLLREQANISFHHRMLVAAALAHYNLPASSQILVGFAHDTPKTIDSALVDEFIERAKYESKEKPFDSKSLIAETIKTITLQSIRSLAHHRNPLAITQLRSLALTHPYLSSRCEAIGALGAHADIREINNILHRLEMSFNPKISHAATLALSQKRDILESKDEEGFEFIPQGPLGHNPVPHPVPQLKGENLVSSYAFEQTLQLFSNEDELKRILMVMVNSSQAAQALYFKEIHAHSTPEFHEQFEGPLNSIIAQQLISLAQRPLSFYENDPEVSEQIKADYKLRLQRGAIKALRHFFCVAVVKFLDQLPKDDSEGSKAANEVLAQFPQKKLTSIREEIAIAQQMEAQEQYAQALLRLLELPQKPIVQAPDDEILEFEGEVEMEEGLENLGNAAE